jgi:uncharacterized protein
MKAATNPKHRYLRFSVWGLFVGLAIWSFGIEPGWLAERRLEIESPKWELPPMSIGVASDLHVGAPHVGLAQIDRLVDGINAAHPDLILLPGDFVIKGIIGGESIEVDAIADHLSRLRAPLGVYAILGNHDWWYDGEKVRHALEARGIHVLENESVVIQHQGQGVRLVGVGDDMTGHEDIRRAFRGTNANLPTIVMVHDPANAPDLSAGSVVAFAGHTHGGQVSLPLIGALITPGRAPRSHAYGWLDDVPVPTFVTSGVGTSILPVRFNRRPEYLIVRVTGAPAGTPVAITRTL